MKKEMIIIGAGSVGGHVASNFNEYSSEFKLLGFLDDDPAKQNINFTGYPVLGTIDQITDYSTDINIVIGIAFPQIKYKIINKLNNLGYHNFPSLISNAAWVSNSVSIGEGCILYPGVSVNYNTTIGDFVILNMNCGIGHDCVIGKKSSFAPGVFIGGNTKVEDFTEMGIGSQSLQNITIGANVIVGAGTVIIRDVPDGVTIVGNPGRIIENMNCNIDLMEEQEHEM